MRRLLIIGSIVAVAVATLAAIYLDREGRKDDGPYRTVQVDRGTVSETVTATGTISAVTTVQVGSQVSGIIAKLHADYNSPVKRGQLLAELDPTPLQAQVEQRTADLAQADVQKRNAEIAFHRAERLKQEGLESDADFDTAKAAFDSAQAQVDMAAAGLRQARTSLSYARIYSPIDGVVVARQYDIGQTVAASFQAPTLFTIAEDLTKMQVSADVDQSDIGRVAVGQTARFTVDAYADETFSGAISQIRLNATQNQNVVTYPVIIDVANPDKRLKPLMTADVTIEVAKIADVLRVPNAALRFRPVDTGRGGAGSGPPGPQGAAGAGPDARPAAPAGGLAGVLKSARPAAGRSDNVYVVDDEGRTREVAVKTGITDGHYTQIVSGDLKPGDKVVTAMATAKVQTTGTLPGQGGGGRPPGMGGRF